MRLAIFQPLNEPDPDNQIIPFPTIAQAFAEGDDNVWTFFKVGKRGGKLYRNQAGTIVYESSLPKGSKKQDPPSSDSDHNRQQQSTSEGQPLSSSQAASSDRKLAQIRSLGIKAVNNIAYATKQSLESKKQAIQQAAKAIRDPGISSTIQRAKKVSIALSRAAFASYHLHAKRYGKPMAAIIEGVKATINFTVSAPFVVIPGAGSFIRNSITGPAVDYVARKTAKQVIRMRQLARGRWKPKQFSEPPAADQLDFNRLVKIIRTSLHVDAIKAKVTVPRVSLEQVARTLESLLNTAIPDEQFSQRKAA